MYEDGYRDPRKVIVKPVDEDRDGVPDDPTILEQVVQNFDQPAQRVYFRKFMDFDGYEYLGLWTGMFLRLEGTSATQLGSRFTVNQAATEWAVSGKVEILDRTVSVSRTDMLILEPGTTITTLVDALNSRAAELLDNEQSIVRQFAGKVVTVGGEFFVLTATADSLGVWTVGYEESNNHASRTGRSFTLNRLLPVQNPLHFRWKHYAPRENRIDPSISNIIDMFVITNSYFRAVQQWKNSNNDVAVFPEAPTPDSLRVQFGELEQFKMMSDQIVFKPGRFKLMFGRGAEPELSARFKVVRLPSTTLTDNEIKSKVIDAIDEYFDISNWDFGERFYYTELSAFVHQRLSNIISTVVIVPQKAESAFGNLFQIKSEVNELFLSTATVSDVDIVRNLTETNLRVRRNDPSSNE